MNRKRNVQFTKPDDPEFLKVLKKQAGYDDRNHKFDKLENEEDDFVDDEESEKPQVVVLKEGDLTAEEADLEQIKIDTLLTETKADLSQRVIFKSKSKQASSVINGNKKQKLNDDKSKNLLSFDEAEDDSNGGKKKIRSKKYKSKKANLLSFGEEDDDE